MRWEFWQALSALQHPIGLLVIQLRWHLLHPSHPCILSDLLAMSYLARLLVALERLPVPAITRRTPYPLVIIPRSALRQCGVI
jgi:hypothetical protein